MRNARSGASRRTFTLLILAVLVVGVGAIAWMTQRRSAPAQVLQLDPNAPAAQAEGYVIGRPDAPVQIIEFVDFECPACAQFATVTGPDVKSRLVDPGIASVRIYDFPINDQAHRNSLRASLAAACANDQGKFVGMHDKLFAGQNDWSSVATDNPTLYFQKYAQELGLDMGAWQSCYDSGKYVGRISSHRAEAMRRGVQSTPSFIVGDRLVQGAVGYDQLKAHVDSARARVAAAPAAAADSGTKK